MARQSRSITGPGSTLPTVNTPLSIRWVGYALRMPARTKRDDDRAADPTKLKRETAGRYTSGDGRFTVEQGSGGWMILDGEQTNELGLPLVRGPFATLDEARDGLETARGDHAPTSQLSERIAELGKRGGEAEPSARTQRKREGRDAAHEKKPEPKAARRPPAEIREFRARDADDLRRLWADADIDASDDDDPTLKRVLERNPGLALVAILDKSVVGSALGSWDGRRGWISHVAVAPGQDSNELGTRLVRELEERLSKLGAVKINAVVRDDDPRAALFWEAADYDRSPMRLFRRELDTD